MLNEGTFHYRIAKGLRSQKTCLTYSVKSGRRFSEFRADPVFSKLDNFMKKVSIITVSEIQNVVFSMICLFFKFCDFLNVIFFLQISKFEKCLKFSINLLGFSVYLFFYFLQVSVGNVQVYAAFATLLFASF